MLTQTIEEIKTAAAGSITGAKEPTNWEPKKHPVAQWINGTTNQREKLINHPGVCGLGFFTANNRFKLFQGVTTWADVDDYGKNAKTVVVGHVGTKTLNPQPSVLPLIELLRDFQQLREKTTGEGEPPCWFRIGKSNIRDWVPGEGQPPVDIPSKTGDWRIVLFPCVIPLVYGHKLTSGEITNPIVKKQILDYHPAMEDWLNAVALQHVAGTSFQDVRHVDSKYLPTAGRGIRISARGYIVTAPVALSSEEDHEVDMYRLTTNTISDLRRANEDRYYDASPHKRAIVLNLPIPTATTPTATTPTQVPPAIDITVQPGAQSIAEQVMHLLGADPLTQGAGGGSQLGGRSVITQADEALQKGFEQARVLLMLEGARIQNNELTGVPEVAYPTITEDWADLYDNSHVAQLSSAFSSLLEAACDDRDGSVHYLDRAINLPEFSQLAAKSFTQVISKRSPLDDDTKFKRNEISILTLLPPPASSEAYKSYCRATHVTELDHMVNQGEKQTTKVGTEIFTGGLQNHPDDVVAALANYDLVQETKYGYDRKDELKLPLAVRCTRDLGDLYSSRQFKNWYNKVHHSAPWITHTLLTQVHSLLSKIANIANNPTNKRHYKTDIPISPQVYAEVAADLQRIKSDTFTTINSSSLGALFTSPPSSYTGPRGDGPRTPNRKREQEQPSPNQRAEQRQRGPDLRGWLQNHTRMHIMIRGVPFCSQFACEGSTCREAGRCDRPHKHFPLDFSLADRLSIANHVKNTPGLTFANHVSLPSYVRGQGGQPAIPPPPPTRPRHQPPATTPRPAAAAPQGTPGP